MTSPPAVAAAFLAHPGFLARNAAVTVATAMAGYLLAATSAGLVGAVLAASRRLERALYPLLVGISTVPKPAVLPPLVVLLGFGPGPKVALVWLMCFFPIVLSVITGLTSTPIDLVDLARSLAASRWRLFTKIRVPAALPHTAAGLRVALPLALIGAVVAELLGGITGLGVVIQAAGTDTALAWAAVVLLAALSTTLFSLLAAVLNAAAPWIRHTTA